MRPTTSQFAASLVLVVVASVATELGAQKVYCTPWGDCRSLPDVKLPPASEPRSPGGTRTREPRERSLEEREPDRKHARWAKEYFDEGHYEAAAEQYRLAIAYDPKFPSYRVSLADILFFNLEKYNEALQAYREYAQLRPNSPQAHYLIAWSLWKLDRDAAAEAELMAAIRLNPKNKRYQEDLKSFATRSYNSIHNGGFQRALKEADPVRREVLYRRLLVADPTNAAALNNLGVALQEQGYSMRAEAAYREAAIKGDAFARSNLQGNDAFHPKVGKSAAFADLLAAQQQGAAAVSRELTLEAMHGRSMRCFDDSRGCMYSGDHAMEIAVLAPTKSPRAPAAVPDVLRRDREFSDLQERKAREEKEYKRTYDALQASWALKDRDKNSGGMIDLLIVEQKNRLTVQRSAIAVTDIYIQKKYVNLGFTPPRD